MNSATSFPSAWTTCRDFLVRHRVGLSALTVGALIVEDLLLKDRPEHGCFIRGDAIGRAAVGLIAVGLAVRSWAAGVLQKGIELTVDGPYSLVRHPLYLGSACMMIGFCMMIGELHDYLVIFGPIIAIYMLTILREEERLAEKYGSRWTEYAARTPRLLPFHPRRYVACRWSIRQWLRRREFQAALGAAAGVALVELVRNW